MNKKLRVIKPKLAGDPEPRMIIIDRKNFDPEESKKRVLIQKIECLYEGREAEFIKQHIESGDITEAMLEQIKER